MSSSTPSIFDLSATSITGAPVPIAVYRGQVLLIVNVASRCGYTAQYQGLEQLYRRYADRGFVVLGFPCNQFGRQEPGTNDDIRDFCARTYDVTFPLFSKVDVNGPDADPVFVLLKSRKKGWLGSEAIKWNFTKFLVDRTGAVVKRYAPADAPDAIEQDVERLL